MNVLELILIIKPLLFIRVIIIKFLIIFIHMVSIVIVGLLLQGSFVDVLACSTVTLNAVSLAMNVLVCSLDSFVLCGSMWDISRVRWLHVWVRRRWNVNLRSARWVHKIISVCWYIIVKTSITDGKARFLGE